MEKNAYICINCGKECPGFDCSCMRDKLLWDRRKRREKKNGK